MKYHPHDSVLFRTFSIEEGLLLLSNPPLVGDHHKRPPSLSPAMPKLANVLTYKTRAETDDGDG
jgi:hypothetical protein